MRNKYQKSPLEDAGSHTQQGCQQWKYKKVSQSPNSEWLQILKSKVHRQAQGNKILSAIKPEFLYVLFNCLKLIQCFCFLSCPTACYLLSGKGGGEGRTIRGNSVRSVAPGETARRSLPGGTPGQPRYKTMAEVTPSLGRLLRSGPHPSPQPSLWAAFTVFNLLPYILAFILHSFIVTTRRLQACISQLLLTDLAVVLYCLLLW